MADKNKNYCGVIIMGCGSSWAWASSVKEAASKAAKTAKRDWRGVFKFKRKHEFVVNVLDMRKRDGWWADYRGFYDSGSKEKIEPYKVVKVVA